MAQPDDTAQVVRSFDTGSNRRVATSGVRLSPLHSAGAAVGINLDQRLQQVVGYLGRLTTYLGIGLLHASILLGSFIGVLWGLSSGFVFHVGERTFKIPGYMF